MSRRGLRHRRFEKRLVAALRAEGLITPRPSRAPFPARARLAAAVGGTVLVAAVGLSLVTREAEGAKSELRFSDPTPMPGATVRVEYRPGPVLADRDRLVLRAEFHAAPLDRQDGSVWVTAVSKLERASDHRFTGSFVLPDSAVYAVFVVEDEKARRIDTNSRAGWDLMAHGSDRRPLREALAEKSEALAARNWELGLSTARLGTELYPDDPRAAAALHSLEAHLFGVVTGDSLANASRARFYALEARHEAEQKMGLEPAAAGWLWVLARAVGDSAAEARWRERVLHLSSNHWLVAQAHLIPVMAEQYSRPEALLSSLEVLWGQFGPVYYQVPLQGLLTAERIGRFEDIRRWANRYLLVRPGEFAWTAARLAGSRLDPVRDQGIGMLRSRLRDLSPDADERSLFMNREEKKLADARERARLHGYLGSALLAGGRLDGAISELEQAAESGWPLDAFRNLGDAKLLAHDSAGALEAWANVAADPATGTAFADSVSSRLGAAFRADRWRDLTRQGRARMRATLLRGTTRREVESGLTLTDPDGRPTAFDDLRKGRVTVVAFWSRFCGPSLEQLPELARLTRSLADMGVRVLAITDEPPSLELAEFIQRSAPALAVFHDSRSELTRALSQWATPEYYVLDRDGDVRFALSQLSDIQRQAAVLTAPGQGGTP